jgi:hypothetical protein
MRYPTQLLELKLISPASGGQIIDSALRVFAEKGFLGWRGTSRECG